MHDLTKELEARRLLLESILPKLRNELRGMPEGKLRLSRRKGEQQYYRVLNANDLQVRKYIRNSNPKLVQSLGQKHYLELLIRAVEVELGEIERVLKRGTLMSSDRVFAGLNEARRALVTPYLLDDETYAEMWQKSSFVPSDYHTEALIYPTRRGEMVRTKSEAMIADMYYDLDIPYKYECPVLLADKKTSKYPDFTLLHRKMRKVFYHEHLGMLDDSGYLKDNMIKLAQYRKIGIYTGNNLILTHEIPGSPLDMRVLRKNTMELFC